jgi:hypothetical protein
MNASQMYDIWYMELIALLDVLRLARPDVVEISRAWRLLDTMDTRVTRRTLFGEAKQHYSAINDVITSKSLESAKQYLTDNGGGGYVTKYYTIVVDCISSLPTDVENDCWERMARLNSRCAPNSLLVSDASEGSA